MIVYVESNFILEVAYLQEQHASCEELLVLAEVAKITLKLPAFSVIEARLSLQQRTHRRRAFQDALAREVRELARSKPYQELSTSTEPLTTALIESGGAEKKGLELILSRFLAKCEVIPMHGTTVQSATRFEAEFNLAPKDAVILASIAEDLGKGLGGLKLFLNRNSKDFANPDIYDQLSKFECKLVPSFADGLSLIRTALSSTAKQEAPPGA
jgi:predicted nucleic acid-binding protein